MRKVLIISNSYWNFRETDHFRSRKSEPYLKPTDQHPYAYYKPANVVQHILYTPTKYKYRYYNGQYQYQNGSISSATPQGEPLVSQYSQYYEPSTNEKNRENTIGAYRRQQDQWSRSDEDNFLYYDYDYGMKITGE